MLPTVQTRATTKRYSPTVFTVIIAVALGAQLTVPQLLGGLIVFAGVALSTLRPAAPSAGKATMDATPPMASAKKPHRAHATDSSE